MSGSKTSGSEHAVISDHSRAASLLVHIPFHFVERRWPYLEKVIKGISELELGRVLVVVDSNTNDVVNLIGGLTLPSHCSVRVDVHPTLAHPFDLTWAHRQHLAASIDAFDYFMYLEDDIYVPTDTFKAWLRRSEAVARKGYIHGFLRVESDSTGNVVAADWRRALRRPATIEIERTKYIRPEAFYQACWVYPRTTMAAFLRSPAWKRGYHPWSSVTRGHRNLVINYVREFSAFGMTCARPGRPRLVLPVGDDGQVPQDAWVWHLPNNYATGSKLRLLRVEELMPGGLRVSLPARWAAATTDLVSEGWKWAAYLLRIDALVQFAKPRVRKFLQ